MSERDEQLKAETPTLYLCSQARSGGFAELADRTERLERERDALLAALEDDGLVNETVSGSHAHLRTGSSNCILCETRREAINDYRAAVIKRAGIKGAG